MAFVASVVTAVVAAGMLIGANCAILPLAPPDASNNPPENPEAVINVAGTFRYTGQGESATGATFVLSGTITFEQQGNQVRISDSTYDFAGLRPVAGDFTELQGNRLVAVLTPINGDTDYVADVTFIFTADGNEFSVGYQDTSGDHGELGSFRGVRQ